MTVFYKGNSPDGFSYQLIYFKDPKGSSHMVMLMDSDANLKKNAAVIQDTINSIRSAR